MNKIDRMNIYGRINGMAKKNIRVIIEGRITDRIKKDFHDRLALALIDQYGLQGAEQILWKIKNDTSQ